MTLKSVVLPAPLGPMMPTRSCSRTSSETARTAVSPPNRLVTLSSVSTGSSGAGRRPRTEARRDASQAIGRPADDEDEGGAIDHEIDAGEAGLHSRERGPQVGLEQGDEDGSEIRSERRPDAADDRVERKAHREV